MKPVSWPRTSDNRFSADHLTVPGDKHSERTIWIAARAVPYAENVKKRKAIMLTISESKE